MKGLPCLLLLICFNLTAQQTERYKKLLSGLGEASKIVDTTHYGNGKINYILEKTTYEYNGGKHQTWTGNSILYYRNGIVARISIMDEYGSFLKESFYDRSSNLKEERITTEIDNRAKNLDEYFESRAFGDIKKTINYYKYSKKTQKIFKYKQEFLSLENDLFIKKRVIFGQNGEVLKTKLFDTKKVKNVW